jgi:hypothetical protein
MAARKVMMHTGIEEMKSKARECKMELEIAIYD